MDVYLKQNVRFHDGTEFNGGSGGQSRPDYEPDVGSQKARVLLDAYTGWIVDPYDYAARVQPYAPLLDALSQVYLGIASRPPQSQHQ